MKIVPFLAALILGAAPALAQSWQVHTSDNGGYAAGSAHLPGYAMAFNCFARSVQNLPLIDTGWHETDIAPPYVTKITFSTDLMPHTPTGSRAGVILFLDGTGYQLPRVDWNEMEGTWAVNLPMADQMFQQLQVAQTIVLQVDASTAWTLPVAGLNAALGQAGTFCANTLAARGIPAPGGLALAPRAAEQAVTAPAPAPAAPAGAFVLPATVQLYADSNCSGYATIGAEALKAGDLDNDGKPDVLLDWGFVRCNGESMRGFCGAANCQFDIFFSTKAYLDPLTTMAYTIDLVPHRSGRLGIRSYTAACARQQLACDEIALWTGNGFVQTP